MSGQAVVQFKIKTNPSLEAWVKKYLPADYSAGCIFTPVEGLSSESWRIEAASGVYLARLQSTEKRQLGIDRRRENRLLRHLSSKHIAPQVYAWACPWLVVNWIAGETLDEKHFFAAQSQQQLAALLAKLHRSQPCGETLDIKRRFADYWQLIDRRRLTPSWLHLHKRLLKQRLPRALKISLAHMDIHPQNWVNSPEGIRLIDWEYAVSADIGLEFAALFSGNAYSKTQRYELLQAYAQQGGFGDVARLEQQVRQWRLWLEYLMLMWFEVRWQQTADIRYASWAQPLRQKLLSEF
ncbi:phosphotransferase [Rouxiella sp. WC2420]|uniref:Thiamine kinase n=1 Tax=Rouxiella sp. WC2420 TaxID=3234145 RepID=A0AB39VNL8_9GAMM